MITYLGEATPYGYCCPLIDRLSCMNCDAEVKLEEPRDCEEGNIGRALREQTKAS